MTLSTTTVRNDYSGSGSAGPFSFTFPIVAASDLAVYKISAIGTPTLLTYVTHYSVTGAGDAAGGSITLVTALAVGEKLSIVRNTPATQPVSLRTLGTFLPDVQEGALDRGTMTVQQADDGVAAAVRLHPAFNPSNYTLSLTPPVAGQFLQWTGTGVSWAQPAAASSVTMGSSLGLSNGSDDTAAIQAILSAADNGVAIGVPGQTYLISSTLTPPNNLLLDLNGATLKPIGSTDLLKVDPLTDTASTTVTAGATMNSNVVTVSSVTNFAVGGIVRFTTDYAVGMPPSWSHITAINSGAKQITLDTPFTFSYSGTVTIHQLPLRGVIVVRNGKIDISAATAQPGAVLNLGGYDRAEVRNIHFSGGASSLNAASNVVSLVSLVQCRTSIIEDSTARNVNLATGACFGSQGPQFGRHSRLIVDGDAFGSIITNADIDIQENIIYRGRLKALNSGRSIRAVKSSSCRHSIYANVYAWDCETVLEIFNCARVNGSNINGTNIGWKTYVGQTAINIAATLGDGYMQHCIINGYNLDNLGGNGVQTSGDSTGRIQLLNGSVKNCYASPVYLATNETRVAGLEVDTWNTGAVSGAAAVVSTTAGDNASIIINDVTASHADTSKPVLNLGSHPRLYQVHNVTSPSGNPIYDTVNGINPGAQNLFVGSLASLSRGPAFVTKLSQVGHLEPFTLPNNQTMTFSFEANGVNFIVSSNTGKAAQFFAENTTAAITIIANPGSGYENSSTPTAGKLGVFKSASARTISIVNKVGGDVDIGIQTLGAAITALTDPA